jgi:E-phenylitaconyl-CoA hydratase
MRCTESEFETLGGTKLAFERIIFEKRDHVAYVTINRPDALNALDGLASSEMYQAFQEFSQDRDMWIAILNGAGDKAFCSGMDLRAAGSRGSGGERPAAPAPFGGLTKGVQIYKPMIAAIHGYCLGGGVELAMCCDIRVAADNARFGMPEVRWGIIPGAGGTQRLQMNVPLSKALEMILTGEQIDAAEAYRVGLVNKVVPMDQLMATAEQYASIIKERAPLAVWAAKEAIMRGRNMPLEDGLRWETTIGSTTMNSEDRAEGMKAFAEKRKPNFQAR